MPKAARQVAVPVVAPIKVEPEVQARITPDQALRLESVRIAADFGITDQDKLLRVAAGIFDYVNTGKRDNAQ